ncbi:MAG: hypothetical protein Q4B68_06135 [Bacteroidales bacterium]|nr:hypothetical protein [Bacteroidales bacterium]
MLQSARVESVYDNDFLVDDGLLFLTLIFTTSKAAVKKLDKKHQPAESVGEDSAG